MSLFEQVNKKVLVIASAAFFVLIVGFIFYLARGKGESTDAITAEGTSPLEGTLGSDLLMTLVRLRSTKLDTSIFSDPIFTSLRDFGVEIAPQPVGRRNPFAPFASSTPAGGKAATKGPALPKGGAGGGAKTPPAASPAEEEEEFSGFDVE